MVGTSWSSSSSCTSSLGSLDDDVVVGCVVKAADAAVDGCVKFLCSYGSRILPRHADGALRYVGGDNRVVSVDRSLSFYGTYPPNHSSSSSVPSPSTSRTVPHAHNHHQTGSAPSCASHQMSSPPAHVLHQQQHYNRHGGEARPHRYLV